jgi:phosphotransferase system IIB component
MSLDDQLIDVGRIGAVERLQAEVVEDQQVHAEQLSHLGVVAVVEPGSLQAFEELIGPLEVHAVTTAHGSVPESGGEKGLADADGPNIKTL